MDIASMSQTGDDATIIQAVEMIGNDAVVLGSIPVTGNGTYRISFKPTGSSVQLWVLGAYDILLKPTCYTYPVTTKETYLVDICDENKDRYRFGFNGQEKDNELKGIGNSLDFGARMYDSRIGKWLSLDPLFLKSPFYTPYNFAANNPIIYVDPDGNTEFYYEGKWIGTDGDKSNNLIGIIKDEKIAEQMTTNSKAGKINQQYTNLKNGSTLGGVGLVIHKDVLTASYEVSKLSNTEPGKVGEYSVALVKNGQNYDRTGAIKYSATKATSIATGTRTTATVDNGDVSIHSHPTFDRWDGNIVRFSKLEASPAVLNSQNQLEGDAVVFKNYELNIIVGKTNAKGTVFDAGTPNEKKVIDPRKDKIVFYNNNANELLSIDAGDAKKMLEEPSGKTYNKFEKAQSNVQTK